VWEDITVGRYFSTIAESQGYLVAEPNAVIDSIRFSDFARYTTSFMPPTAKLPCDAGALLVLNFDQSFGAHNQFTVGKTYDSGAQVPVYLAVRRDFSGAVLTNVRLDGLLFTGSKPNAGLLRSTVESEFSNISVSAARGLQFIDNCYVNRIRNYRALGGDIGLVLGGASNDVVIEGISLRASGSMYAGLIWSDGRGAVRDAAITAESNLQYPVLLNALNPVTLDNFSVQVKSSVWSLDANLYISNSNADLNHPFLSTSGYAQNYTASHFSNLSVKNSTVNVYGGRFDGSNQAPNNFHIKFTRTDAGDQSRVNLYGSAAITTSAGASAVKWTDTPAKVRLYGTYEPLTATTTRLRSDADNPYVVLADADTINWYLNGATTANAVVTLGGNRQLSMTNLVAGAAGTLIVKQDGSGNRTLTLPAGSKIQGGTLALSTAANATDILAFTYDGANLYWTVVGRGYQ
jgi:hypothetical protein